MHLIHYNYNVPIVRIPLLTPNCNRFPRRLRNVFFFPHPCGLPANRKCSLCKLTIPKKQFLNGIFIFP